MLDRWDVADLAVESSVVPPVDPFERRELNVVQVAPRSMASHEFGLVEPDGAFSEDVVVAVATAADGGGNACSRTGRALRVPRARTRGRGKKLVTAEIMISERPAEADDRDPRRAHLVTSAAFGVESIDQPTTRRLKTSRTSAQQTLPSRVGCSVMSVSQRRSGSVRANWRSTRSPAVGWFGMRRYFGRPDRPCRPALRINNHTYLHRCGCVSRPGTATHRGIRYTTTVVVIAALRVRLDLVRRVGCLRYPDDARGSP